MLPTVFNPRGDTRGVRYPPVPDGGGSAPPGGGFVPDLRPLPHSVAMPVHAVPVHHVYGAPTRTLRPRAPAATGVARIVLLPTLRGCFEPPRTVAAALRGTSSPPTFSSASAPCSTGSRSITSSRCISVSSSPPGPPAAGLSIPTTAARAEYNLAEDTLASVVWRSTARKSSSGTPSRRSCRAARG